MKWVYICSPYRGDRKQNAHNARMYSRAAVKMGYLAIAPHLLYTQFLDDNDEEERKIGLECGLDILRGCDEMWVFSLDSPSEGMKAEIKEAEEWHIPVKNGFEMIQPYIHSEKKGDKK